MMFVASVHRLSAAAPLATPTRGASRYRRSAAPRPVVALDGNQLEAALEHQLRRSREAQAAAEPKAQPAQSAVPARKASRREEAAAAEAAEAARQAEKRAAAQAAQAELRKRSGTLDDHALQAALKMQLKQSGSFVEEEEQEPAAAEPAAATAQVATAAAVEEPSAEGGLRRPRRPAGMAGSTGASASSPAASASSPAASASSKAASASKPVKVGDSTATTLEDGSVLFKF